MSSRHCFDADEHECLRLLFFIEMIFLHTAVFHVVALALRWRRQSRTVSIKRLYAQRCHTLIFFVISMGFFFVTLIDTLRH